MEEVLKSVKDAEALAAAKKAEAEAKAEELITASRARANEIIKKTEQELKSFRETALSEAEAIVKTEAERTLNENKGKDTKAADALLKDTAGTVSQIVRRIVDGDRRHA